MYTSFIRPILFRLDPEKAHHLATRLGTAFCRLPAAGPRLARRHAGRWPVLGQNLLGIRFDNPVGMAAGFDKNAGYAELLRFMGFGYAEYGSITARPSSGNPQPRLFRLKEDRALINRMGLNNTGAETVCRHLREMKASCPDLFDGYPCGINIAKTHDPSITGDDAIRDYVTSYGFARKAADYVTLNISCPNTREGKTFEDEAALEELLNGLDEVREAGDPPLLVKFSPDTDDRTSNALVSICEDHDIRGYVVTNTSTGRGALHTPQEQLNKIGAGGLSGAPLFAGTRRRVMRMRSMLPEERILVACGGIDTPDKALQLLADGANLLQLYTGLIYEGPSLVTRINDTLTRKLNDLGAPSLAHWQDHGT
jgi:dihydroorotate dehydrogenase